MQQSLIPVRIVSEVDAKERGFDGTDLKRIALCDDGNTYAMKRVEDHPHMPISEWVGHHLCRQVGIKTPDFSTLTAKDGAPSFGSRIAHYQQIEHSPGSFRVNSFFSGHQAALSAVYALGAVITNPDQHGRNLFIRADSGGATLLAFDFSRSWMVSGLPFGNQEAMRDSHTQHWWKTFKRMGCKVDDTTLSLMEKVDVGWLSSVLQAAPREWISDNDAQATLDFWKARAPQRIGWAKLWLT